MLEHLDLAWSRELSGPKEYVQHRMRAHGPEIWKWLADGAYFYVCGDKERMAKDVHEELIRIVQTHGGTIRAESELNAGSNFTFTLPKALSSIE